MVKKIQRIIFLQTNSAMPFKQGTQVRAMG